MHSVCFVKLYYLAFSCELLLTLDKINNNSVIAIILRNTRLIDAG